MEVIRSGDEKVDCISDAKCYAESFNSSTRYSMYKSTASCLFAFVLPFKVITLCNYVNHAVQFELIFLIFPVDDHLP